MVVGGSASVARPAPELRLPASSLRPLIGLASSVVSISVCAFFLAGGVFFRASFGLVTRVISFFFTIPLSPPFWIELSVLFLISVYCVYVCICVFFRSLGRCLPSTEFTHETL